MSSRGGPSNRGGQTGDFNSRGGHNSRGNFNIRGDFRGRGNSNFRGRGRGNMSSPNVTRGGFQSMGGGNVNDGTSGDWKSSMGGHRGGSTPTRSRGGFRGRGGSNRGSWPQPNQPQSAWPNTAQTAPDSSWPSSNAAYGGGQNQSWNQQSNHPSDKSSAYEMNNANYVEEHENYGNPGWEQTNEGQSNWGESNVGHPTSDYTAPGNYNKQGNQSWGQSNPASNQNWNQAQPDPPTAPDTQYGYGAEYTPAEQYAQRNLITEIKGLTVYSL